MLREQTYLEGSGAVQTTNGVLQAPPGVEETTRNCYEKNFCWNGSQLAIHEKTVRPCRHLGEGSVFVISMIFRAIQNGILCSSLSERDGEEQREGSRKYCSLCWFARLVYWLVKVAPIPNSYLLGGVFHYQTAYISSSSSTWNVSFY